MNKQTWIRMNGQREVRDNLRTAAKDAGLSGAELARRADVEYRRLSSFLRGSSIWIRREEVEALAVVLEVSADELLGDSIYKGDPRSKEFGFPPNHRASGLARVRVQERMQAPTAAEPGRLRALCCECGQGRLVSGRAALTVYDNDHRTLRGRMLGEYICQNCGRTTEHAILRDHDEPENRDSAEIEQQAPSAEQIARRDLDELVRRLESFNVDVHWRTVGEDVDGVHCVFGAQYDTSKSRWRFEIDPAAPAVVTFPTVKAVWSKRIAPGDLWDSYRPGDGYVWAGADHRWDEAVGDLLEGVRRGRSAVMRQILDAQSDSADRSDA